MLKLIDETQQVFAQTTSTLLRLRPPLKIFGSLHGNFYDLLKFFELFKAPSDDHHIGDIESFDYLFLGNYIDRGKYSLETIFLLLALKLKYPDQIHLLRGAHEDIKVNRVYGFAEECERRLGENINEPNSIYQKLNKLFDYLPLAALVADRLLCVHSGIGASALKSVDDIDNIYRPAEIVKEPSASTHQMLLDLLWSDPSLGESENTAIADEKREVFGTSPALTRYTSERLSKFMNENNLHLIIRSHDIAQEGYKASANGTLISLTSVTDYLTTYQNAAAIITITKGNDIQPKVIYPQSNSMEEEISKRSTTGKMGMSHGGGGYGIQANNSWMDSEDSMKKRTTTPPRVNPKGALGKK